MTNNSTSSKPTLATLDINALDGRFIKQAIDDECITNIHIFDSLNSTNAWALQQAKCGEVCLAEQQTAGRGRRGRAWHSPLQGNLYLSLKWCFGELPEHFGLLSLFIGVVVAECLKEEGLNGHGLKWPNDIIWQGKKLGGILLESKGNPCHIVIGIGLNIAMQNAQIDQPWTSLNTILKREVDRNAFAGKLLSALAKRLDSFPQLNMDTFINEWAIWDILRNQTVNVLSQNQTIQAHVIGITTQGMLEVRLPNGEKQAFLAADVSVKW